MYNLEFRTRAYKNIQEISKKYIEEMLSIDKAFSELESSGSSGSNIKTIGRIQGGLVYRKRIGRWRIVFIVKEKIIDVFLIELEKDTSKNYNEWIEYIVRSIKGDKI